MHPLPPLTLTISRHSTWNAAVYALAAMVIAVLAAWAWTWSGAIGPGHAAGSAALVVVILWLVRGLPIRQPMTLAWDGAGWRLGAGADLAGAECRAALDLGLWMLLQCRGPDGSRFLPVSRAQAPADWHALRCAVHAPRPASVRDDPGAGTLRPW